MHLSSRSPKNALSGNVKLLSRNVRPMHRTIRRTWTRDGTSS